MSDPTGLIDRLTNGGFKLCPEGTQTVADTGTAFVNYRVLTQTASVQTSQLTAASPGQARAIRITQTQSTAQRFGLAQTISAIDCQDLRTFPITGAHQARFSVSAPARTMFAILEWDGTADSAPADPIADWTSASYVPGQFFVSNVTVLNYGFMGAAENVWANAPYIPYQVGASCNNLIYVVWTENAVAQNATLDLSLWQIIKGPNALQFEYRPLALEEAMAAESSNTTPVVLTNIAALQSATYTTTNAPLVVQLESNYAADDGGGSFYFAASDTTSTDDGGIIIVTASGRRYKRLYSGYVHLSWYTAGGDSVDCRPQFQNALDYCFTNKHTLFVPARGTVYAVAKNTLGNYCLLNQGVSIKFEESPTGRSAEIIPFSTVTSAVDIHVLTPPAGTVDFLEFKWMRINPNYSGTPLGKRAFYANISNSTSMQNMLMDHCRFDQGNDISFYFNNPEATNPQGVPFGLQVIGGYYVEGVTVVGISDSCAFRDFFVRTTTGSGRIGLDIQTVSIAGSRPQRGEIENVNIDADGGAIRIQSGYGWDLRSLDLEQSHGTTAAVLDIAGTDEALLSTTIDGLSLNVFGTASVTSAVRINAAANTQIRNYKLESAATGGGFTAPTNGILVTASASNTTIDATGSYILPGRFTNDISDSGAATRYITLANASTDNAVARYDGTKGAIQNSGVTIDDSNTLTATNYGGTTTNNNAAAGSIGEIIESTVLIGAAVSLTSTVIADVTTISLTAGDWDVWGLVALTVGGSTTMTTCAAWINTTSASSPTAPNSGKRCLYAINSLAGQSVQVPAGFGRLSLSGTTTVYLSTNVAFAVSTCAAYGYIGARRVR